MSSIQSKHRPNRRIEAGLRKRGFARLLRRSCVTLGPMLTRVCLLAVLCIPVIAYPMPSGCESKPRVVRYEPESVTLSGTISISTHKHPNGTILKHPILRLSAPIAVKPSQQADPINSPEPCVRDIHLFSTDKSVHASLYKFGAYGVTVTGSLFHGHTAWHSRNVVMSVTSASKG